jgi:hypothetical protein
MPELSAIEAGGNSSVRFSGFEGERLDVEASDASEVTGTGSRFDDAACTVAKAGKIDLGSCDISNAEIDAGWAGSIVLHMTGGTLRGKAGQSASIVFSGDADVIDIRTSGTINFRKTGSR